MSHVTAKQIRHFLELDEHGDGYGEEFNAFIRQITSGGIAKTGKVAKAVDIRRKQAKKYWDRGFGRKFKNFAAYLVTIPEVPASLLADNPEFPLLVLVDPRLGHVESCRLAGLKYVEYGNDDDTLVPCDNRHAMPTDAPYWVRAHDGLPNLNRKPADCLAECTGRRYAGTADIGIAIYVQYGKRQHFMDLPGSVHRHDRADCAYLDVWVDGPELRSYGDGYASPGYGSVVFVRELQSSSLEA